MEKNLLSTATLFKSPKDQLAKKQLTKPNFQNQRYNYQNIVPVFLDTTGKKIQLFILGAICVSILLIPTFYFLVNDLATTYKINNLLGHSNYIKKSIKVEASKKTKTVWATLNSKTTNAASQLRQSESKINNLILEVLDYSNNNIKLQNTENTKQILDYLRSSKESLKTYLKIDIKNLNQTSDYSNQIQNLLFDNSFNGVLLDISNQTNLSDSELIKVGELGTRLLQNDFQVSTLVSEDLSSKNIVTLNKLSPDILSRYTNVKKYQTRLGQGVATIPVFDLASSLYEINESGPKLVSRMSYFDALNKADSFDSDIANLKNSELEFVENERKYLLKVNDAPSIYNQLLDIESSSSLSALAINQLGFEEPAVLDIIRLENNQERLNYLNNHFTATNLVKTEGTGQIVELITNAQSGIRNFITDSQGHITSQKITLMPIQAIVKRSGNSQKQIALTFDDGPDPIFTPKILDILKANNVQATFYVIGEQVQKYPEIARRIVDEGHTIGNHTFTHPHSSLINPETLINEIIATNIIIKSKAGVDAKYFRVPYNDIQSYETNIDTQILQIAQSSNLVLAGFDMDPRDWEVNNKDEIISNTLEIAKNGGGQLLLHDAGGDRSSTALALPVIIEKLKESGIKLVSTDELVKTSKLDDSNAVLDRYLDKVETINKNWFDTPTIEKNIGGLAVGSMKWIDILLKVCLFLSLLQLGITIFALIFNLISKAQKNNSTAKINNAQSQVIESNITTPQQFSISILVPCYNENILICKTINSLLNSAYCKQNPTKFEIIIIDDGSKDDTYQVLLENYSNIDSIKIFTKPNGGKARALNYGLTKAKNDLVVCIDADTLFDSMAITELVKHFANSKVGGVAGNVIVGNGKPNLLTQCQNLEYTFSQNFTKIAQEWLGCITVVPGAIGVWRRQILIDIGGYEPDTLAEDADLTIRILERGWRIKYEPKAFSVTEAPENWTAFWKQRFRWQFGSLQVLFKNIHLLFNPQYGTLGLFALPCFLLYYFFMIISPLTNLVLITYFLKLVWYFFDPVVVPFSKADLNGITQIGILFLAYILLDFVTNLTALILEKHHSKSYTSVIFLVAQTLIIKPLLYVISIKVILKALLGQVGGWGHLKRTGSVKG